MQEITGALASQESLNQLPILQHLRSVRDQSKLNSQQRSSNISGAFTTSINSPESRVLGNTRPLIIVDDLVTTGATLVEAIRALHSVGFEVLGAVTGAVANPYD